MSSQEAYERQIKSGPSSLFFRLLASDDKGGALGQAMTDLGDGQPTAGITYSADPSDFRTVPGSPFAYWVSEALRRKFQELPPFESEGRTVRVGLQTSDDPRFVRAWWEVAPERILDGANGPTEDIGQFQTWCRERTFQGKRWVPFAKGGEYSPYYADIYLVVNWERDGAEMRAFGPAVIRNPDFYFRPGLTWPLRGIHLSVQAVPRGAAFSVAGKLATSQDRAELPMLLGLMNSRVFDYFVGLFAGKVGGVQYEVGLIGRVPVPVNSAAGPLMAIALQLTLVQIDAERQDERSHPFFAPALLCVPGVTLAARTAGYLSQVGAAHERSATLQGRLDELVYELYSISPEDRRMIAVTAGPENSSPTAMDANNESDDEELEEETAALASQPHLTAELLSYAFGCAFGRWDVRFATGERLRPELPDPFDPLPICSPGMLIGPDGLPAREAASSYPLHFSWDGILVDDPGQPEDVIQSLRSVLALLWPSEDGSRAEEIAQEACEILDVRDLREYFRKPGNFFAAHLQKYSKSRRQAPIYWPLSTASGSYTLWVYYHRLTTDTLYTAVNKYVEPKINSIERGLREEEGKLTATTGRDATRLREQVESTRAFLAELCDLRDELLRVAALPFHPNLDDGVIINAAPLHKLFRLPKWAKDTTECWEKLQRGDYDWAHLAHTIWPDRVREKCRTDRSLAIAHGLEELYQEQVTPTRKRARKPGAEESEES